jgi:ParB family transcriptional regulator, chromosome partitioning protein
MSVNHNVQQRSLDQLHDHPQQAAMFGDVSDADLEALAADIEQNGLHHPVEILPDGTILSGHQRVRAALSLGGTHIDVIVREDLADDPKAAELHFLAENLNRRQLSKLGKRL